ncbi:hypothetical protein KEM56_006429, partial [Ascosphaera pollenicola]
LVPAITHGETGLEKCLRLFWTDDRVDRWLDAAGTGADTPSNMITLSYNAHAYHGHQYFAFRLAEPPSDNEMKLEFHWLPRRTKKGRNLTISHKPAMKSDLVDRLHLSEQYRPSLFKLSNGERLKTGDVITITTDDPVKRPLLSPAAVEMQWYLQRVMALAEI